MLSLLVRSGQFHAFHRRAFSSYCHLMARDHQGVLPQYPFILFRISTYSLQPRHFFTIGHSMRRQALSNIKKRFLSLSIQLQCDECLVRLAIGSRQASPSSSSVVHGQKIYIIILTSPHLQHYVNIQCLSWQYEYSSLLFVILNFSKFPHTQIQASLPNKFPSVHIPTSSHYCNVRQRQPRELCEPSRGGGRRGGKEERRVRQHAHGESGTHP